MSVVQLAGVDLFFRGKIDAMLLARAWAGGRGGGDGPSPPAAPDAEMDARIDAELAREEA